MIELEKAFEEWLEPDDTTVAAVGRLWSIIRDSFLAGAAAQRKIDEEKKVPTP